VGARLGFGSTRVTLRQRMHISAGICDATIATEARDAFCERPASAARLGLPQGVSSWTTKVDLCPTDTIGQTSTLTQVSCTT